ncbi:S-layer homology domain-containing protein [Paenibacillus polysaccharolyticus]|uniref:S-layer homology domain-containing protein n=1 Tax=Paenibacillus polysaccharolyticus TaxID=582692 RepID=UPI0020A07D18|nr:S-layer homology domain-containing protein [Paenibacillus polysaccharolyticus]MCP1135870.1 S-layer homology domain-containing protein [Paenibacillus polysaccharolyticus]
MNYDWKKVLLTVTAIGMIYGNQSVLAAEQTESTSSVVSSFSDQKEIRSASLQSVQEAVKQGLISGYPDGSFHPQQSLTRREMAVLLAKATRLQLEQTAVQNSEQVDWALPYIEAIRAKGWMTGDAQGDFHANDPIRREELASILVRVTGTQGVQGGMRQSISDESKWSEWAKSEIHTALKMGLLKTNEGVFDSKALVERQDIAQILVDVFQSGERTATLTDLDGDVAYIDGTPFIISGDLLKILSTGNKTALQKAIVTYNAETRKISSLSEIQLMQKGTTENPVTLDTRNSGFQGVISVAVNHVVLKADSLSQVVLKPGASELTVDGNIGVLRVENTEKMVVKGSGTWKEIKFNDPKSVITLPDSIKTDQVILPGGGKLSQIIRNTPEPATTSSSNAGNSPSGSGSNVSNGPSTTVPVPAPTPEIPSVVVPPSPVNHKPVVKASIPDKSVFIGDGSQEIDLQLVFGDEDQDELKFEISSIDSTIASAEIVGKTLKVQPVALGNTLITVKASDEKGGVESASFNYGVLPKVIPPINLPIPPIIPLPINYPPVGVKNIPDVKVDLGTESKQVQLAGIFSDIDGDQLTYTADSTATDIVGVRVEGDMLTLEFQNKTGSATVTVKAKDPKGEETGTTFSVNVEDPDKGKGLFISEVAWGDGYDQAIELYNPTSKAISGEDITIVRSDSANSITLDSGMVIASKSTLIVAEELSMAFDDSYYYVNLNLSGQTNPVTLKLYYKGNIIDTALIVPAKSLTRKRETLKGSVDEYLSADWADMGNNHFDDLGTFAPLSNP